jgi:predicted  nucleic acid-binding Zn-ribbon protein
MYVNEKTLKTEIREMQSTVNEVANDLGGDIRYLHQEITDLRNEIIMLRTDFEELKEKVNAKL